MKFSIITPTYKRRTMLNRSVQSLLAQSYTNWEMIVVNDSPGDLSYENFTVEFADERIHYVLNDINRGVNYSRNRALDMVSKNSDWVIFLDDDDYLAPEALEGLRDLIIAHSKTKWFVTNRAYANDVLVTKYPKSEKWYSYTRDVLILKRCRGDVTHCIKTDVINNIRYSRFIKQAEEWIFYYQLGLHEKMYYCNQNSTITDGYDVISGLNFRKRTKAEQFRSFYAFIQEGYTLNILHRPSFLLYLFVRFLRIFLKQ